MRVWPVLIGAVMGLIGCGGSAAEPVAADASTVEVVADGPTDASTVEVVAEPTRSLIEDELFPEVIGAKATRLDATSWRIEVTMSSEYDSPSRYADAWRVLDGDEVELGIRVLTHDHASEQPFTRSVTVDIPSATTNVFIEGRDQRNGWSGQRFGLALS